MIAQKTEFAQGACQVSQQRIYPGIQYIAAEVQIESHIKAAVRHRAAFQFL